MTSRPLFIMVAESTEILRPISQFGWAHVHGRDIVQLGQGAAAKRATRSSQQDMLDADPVQAAAEARGQALNTALCSLSIGRICAPLALQLP